MNVPKKQINLNTHDIKQAIIHWVESGCPLVDDVSKTVHVQYHNFDGSADPREQSYFTASVMDG